MNKTKQPRKQRKRMYDMPMHKRRIFLSAALDKKLKAEHKKNAIPVVKGDKVKILIGEYKNKEGKVTLVNLKKGTIGIEGITSKKPNGKEKFIAIQPSNVIITELNLKDEKRKNVLKRK